VENSARFVVSYWKLVAQTVEQQLTTVLFVLAAAKNTWQFKLRK
jgi:hypothetical protein